MTFKGAILAIYNGKSLEERLKDRVSAKEIRGNGYRHGSQPQPYMFLTW